MTVPARRRIGILGGTFDPPHVGHLMVASDVFTALQLDRLLLVPSASPPHKRGKVRATAEQRVEMMRSAIAGDERFEVDDLELRRDGASYSVDTLRELRSRYGEETELYFVVGMDQLKEFHTWREPDEVSRLARLVAVSRDGEEPEPGGPVTIPVRVTRVDLSATDVRGRVQAGESIRYFVPDPVREFIEREGLYR